MSAFFQHFKTKIFKILKTVFTSMILLILSSQHSFADTFLETIVALSARDAVTIEGDSLFASNYNTGRVSKIELDGTVSEVLGTGNRGPAGIRFDEQGNMYIAMYNDNSVIKIDPQGNETEFAAVNEPIALDWDSAGNLYVSSFAGDTTVTQISPAGVVVPLATINQLSQVSSLCLDDLDNVYVTSYASGDIYQVTPDGGVSLFASTGIAGISYLQFDTSNNVFYATGTQLETILSIDIGGSTSAVINTPSGGFQDGPLDIATIDSAIGLAVSDDGQFVYFATDTHIRRINFADPTVEQVRPYFTSDDSTSVNGGEPFTHTFVFADPNNDVLSLTVDNVPAWMSFDGVDTVSGTPVTSQSSESVTLAATVSDGFDSVPQSFGLTVNAVNTPTTPDPTPSGGSSGGGSTGPIFLIFVFIAYVIRRFM